MSQNRVRLSKKIAVVALCSSLVAMVIWFTIAPQKTEIIHEVLYRTDLQIYNVVMSDIIRTPGFPNANSSRTLPVVVHERTHYIVPLLGDAEIESDLIDSFKHRNTRWRQARLDNFHPTDPMVVVADVSTLVENVINTNNGKEQVRALIWFGLPSYSRDAKTAIIFFNFGPTEHGAVGRYLLKYNNGTWIIQSKRFTFFT